MKKFSLLISFLLVLFLAACGSDNKTSGSDDTNKNDKTVISVKHELDEKPVEVQKNPEKVVVFDWGILDTLDKLGVKVAGIPKGGSVPPYISQYDDDQYVNVGNLKEPDFEAISEIGPDLIIISGRQGESYDELKKIAPTIYLAIDTSRYVESFKENMEILGKIFGKEDEIQSELETIDKKIEEASKKIKETGKNALFVIANDGKVSAFGPGSRYGLMYDVLGFTPVDSNLDASTHGQSISFEYIAEKNPDYLFVVDRTAAVGGESSAKEVIENDLVKNTKAYKEGHIVYLDPNYWYLSGGGVVSFSAMIDEVLNALK